MNHFPALTPATDQVCRRDLLAALAAHPYAGVVDLARATGRGRGTVRYHLRILERTGHVRACRIAKAIGYVHSGLVRRLGRASTAPGQANLPLLDRLVFQATLVLRAGPMRQAEVMDCVASAAGASKVAAYKAVLRAARLGLIERSCTRACVWLSLARGK